jgi:hypothetical protein
VEELHKDGTVHWHAVFFNQPYFENEQMWKAWPHGRVQTIRFKGTSVQDIQKVAGYTAKYLTKSSHLSDQISRRMYTCSTDLRQPEEYVDPLDVHLLLLDLGAEYHQLKKTDWYEMQALDNRTRYETWIKKTPPDGGVF